MADTTNQDHEQEKDVQAATSRPREMANERDLGTVGGGTVPNPNPGNAAGATTGTGAEADHGRTGNPDLHSTTEGSKIDRQAQSNLGGRDPGQPQTSMGDRDATYGGRGQGPNEEIIDPMTSRHPDKVNQASHHDQPSQKEQAPHHDQSQDQSSHKGS